MGEMSYKWLLLKERGPRQAMSSLRTKIVCRVSREAQEREMEVSQEEQMQRADTIKL